MFGIGNGEEKTNVPLFHLPYSLFPLPDFLRFEINGNLSPKRKFSPIPHEPGTQDDQDDCAEEEHSRV